MFESIRIRNFKSFVDSGDVRLAPLTLLLGVNSGGKSSLLQPLLVLGQSVTQVGRTPFGAYPLATNGQFTQLGDYREFIRGHDLRRRTHWDFTVGSEEGNYVAPTGRKTDFEWPLDVAYQVQIAARNRGEDIILASSSLELPRQGATFSRDGTKTKWRTRRGAVTLPKSGRRSLNLPNRNDLGFGWPTRQYAPDSDDSKEARDAQEASELHTRANRALMAHFLGLSHSPPYREVPQRVYLASPSGPSEDLASQTRRLLRRPAASSFVKRWLSRFGVADDIDTNRLVEGLLTLRLTDSTTHVRSNLADFGFGTSQLLPLLIDLSEAATSRRRGWPISHVIQQPEVHLHPAAQSMLADLLVETVGEGHQVFVETHSEHLVYRVQRLVAEGLIKGSDVAIHYVDKVASGSRVKSIDLTELGTFAPGDGLPEGFLDTGLKESLEFHKALAKGSKS